MTILGSGSSTWTPAIDKGWGRSDPTEPRNRRTRPSILVEEGPTDRIFTNPTEKLTEDYVTGRFG